MADSFDQAATTLDIHSMESVRGSMKNLHDSNLIPRGAGRVTLCILGFRDGAKAFAGFLELIHHRHQIDVGFGGLRALVCSTNASVFPSQWPGRADRSSSPIRFPDSSNFAGSDPFYCFHGDKNRCGDG